MTNYSINFITHNLIRKIFQNIIFVNETIKKVLFTLTRLNSNKEQYHFYTYVPIQII